MYPDDILGIGKPGIKENVLCTVPGFDRRFQHVQHDVGSFAKCLFATLGSQRTLIEGFRNANHVMGFR